VPIKIVGENNGMYFRSAVWINRNVVSGNNAPR
jgi:hypothetical protein